MSRTNIYALDWWFDDKDTSYAVSFINTIGERKTAIRTFDGHLIITDAEAVCSVI
jgi:hypothetical protein